jgi:hypothetical protein
LPWSTCPIVPTFACGFVRSNFAFDIFPGSPLLGDQAYFAWISWATIWGTGS